MVRAATKDVRDTTMIRVAPRRDQATATAETRTGTGTGTGTATETVIATRDGAAAHHAETGTTGPGTETGTEMPGRQGARRRQTDPRLRQPLRRQTARR